MIDITTLQVNPIPLPIAELQKANVNLKGENKILRNIIIGVLIFGGLVLANEIYTNYKKDDKRFIRKRL